MGIRKSRLFTLLILPLLFSCSKVPIYDANEGLTNTAILILETAKSRINVDSVTSELSFIGAIDYEFENRPLQGEKSSRFSGLVYSFEILSYQPSDIEGEASTETRVVGVAQVTNNTLAVTLDLDYRLSAKGQFIATTDNLIIGTRNGDYTPTALEMYTLLSFKVNGYYRFDLDALKAQY